MTQNRIEDFALIGDCETSALVGLDGCIDWLCWPRFDSPACFAALVGDDENGHWRIAPLAGSAATTRRYRGDTLILETRFETSEGVATVIDFMPPRGEASDVVRMVRGDEGRVAMRSVLRLRFGYGRVIPWVGRLEDGTLRAIAGPDMVVFRAPVEFHGENKSTVAEFTVSAGETVPFTLTYGPSHLPVPGPIDADQALADTERFWTDWRSRYRPEAMDRDVRMPERWEAATIRSLVTLKALTYAPTGGIVAAPTASLPEKLGGERNWDYRYCWLRDSAITLFALLNSSYVDEARAWRDWLVRAMAGNADDLQIMYGLAGERRIPEWEAEWLAGYAGSRPVRIGNGAQGQRQLDVYGEVMNTLYQARKGGLAEDAQAWAQQRAMLAHLGTIWREPDEGIWEVRGPRRHFTFSKAMCWVAYDRCIRSAEEFGLDESPLQDWRNTRDAIHADICANAYDAERNCFVQAYGESELDASLLLLPQLGFIGADDPRFIGTVAQIERDLLADGFVRRYRTREELDGLPPGEGAFLACSFWLVNAYALTGRLEEAEALFERLLDLRNDVGLLAEEYEPAIGRQLGNFPQAFSHVALANAAHRLAQVRHDTSAAGREVTRR